MTLNPDPTVGLHFTISHRVGIRLPSSALSLVPVLLPALNQIRSVSAKFVTASPVESGPIWLDDGGEDVRNW